MIYFDNAATSFQKPEQVARIMYETLCRYGPGKSYTKQENCCASYFIYRMLKDLFSAKTQRMP